MKITVLTICNNDIDLKKHNGLFELAENLASEVYSICVFSSDKVFNTEINLPKNTVIFQCDFLGDMKKLGGAIAENNETDIMLITKNTLGNEFAGFFGTKTGASVMLNSNGISVNGGEVYITKKVYSENLMGEFQCNGKLVATMNSLKSDINYTCTINHVTHVNTGFDGLEGITIVKAEENALEQCEILVAIGRGVKKNTLEKYQQLAEKLGGEIGGTRPVTYDGIIDLSRMIGNSGKAVSAKVAIVFGASGALPFVAGIENCGTILSINKDENAMIFKTSNYGIVGDVQEFVDMLLEKI